MSDVCRRSGLVPSSIDACDPMHDEDFVLLLGVITFGEQLIQGILVNQTIHTLNHEASNGSDELEVVESEVLKEHVVGKGNRRVTEGIIRGIWSATYGRGNGIHPILQRGGPEPVGAEGVEVFGHHVRT